MNSPFSHLVWLGAGSAMEPENLLDLAENVTLFEAREVACVQLRKIHPQKNIIVEQMVLTADGAPVEFTEYNLAEYSAVSAIAGLKDLFPGIKSFKCEQLKSVSIVEAIGNLPLKNSNNLLVVDIADSSLALLTALQESKQLDSFSEIYIQTSNDPLYSGAATTVEIKLLLQTYGYVLQQTNNHDPDLPWLVFGLNPLWQALKQAQDANNLVNGEIEQVKQQLAAAKKALAESNADEKIRPLEDGTGNDSDETLEKHGEIIRSVQLELEKVSKQLAGKSKQVKEKQEQIQELILANKAIELERVSLKVKLDGCMEQLARADAQYQLIKDLIRARGLKGDG